MANYSRFEAMAKRMLKKSGQEVTLCYQIGGTESVATGTITDPLYTRVKGYGFAGRFKNMEIDGEVIRSSDVKLILENIDVEPETGWEVEVNGKDYRVMNVDALNPGGQNIIYYLQLRI